MLIVKLLVGGLLIIGTMVLLIRWHRAIRSENGFEAGSSAREKSGANAAELEALIAAYRRDKTQSDVAAPPPPPPPQPITSWTARKSFATPHIKLCYLVLKAGLPDHHVF